MGVMTGVARRFSLNCLLLILACLPTFAQVPPGAPSITGPQVIIMGNQYTLICTVNGGIPTPTVKWLRDDSVIDDSYTTVGQVTTNEYTFTASSAEHLEVFECQSENGILQNPLSRTVFVEVNRAPSPPVLSGPTDILSGTPTTWTCRSEGAYPQQSMQMRVGNNVFANEFSSNVVFDTVAESYTMTGTLNWAPTMVNNGNTLFCDVFHPATLGANAPQTVSLPLTVRSPLAVNAPNTLYTPKVGNPVTLQCVVTSGTATQIRWYKNNQLLNLIGNARYSGATPSNPSLTINQVILTDSGNYICEGSNANTFRNTSVITVSPRSTPSTPILNGPTQLTQGETGTWTCTSRGGYPEQRMGMRIGNSNFNNELSVQSVFDNTARTYTLTGTLVWAPNMGHNGMTVYCDVTHPETLAAPQTVSLPLTVLSPLSVNAPTTFYNPTEETSVTLTCVVTSGTATGIRWYKNNQQMSINGRFSGGNTANPSLTITNVQLSDGGNYICEATDGFSSPRTNTITVQVQEKPATEYYIITTVLDGYNKLVRPIDPVNNITHSLIPMEIMDFDKKKLVMQAMQCMNWNDPRLSWTRGQPRISLPASVIWIPDIVLYGQKYMPDFDTKVIVMKDGSVTYCPQGPLMATDCTEKAGEKYECTFKFLSWSYDKVMLDKYFPGFLQRPSIDMTVYREHHEYEIVSKCAIRNEMTYPCRIGTYPQLTYTFVLSRDRNFCINRSMNPTCN